MKTYTIIFVFQGREMTLEFTTRRYSDAKKALLTLYPEASIKTYYRD